MLCSTFSLIGPLNLLLREAAESVLSHAERPGIPGFMHELQEAERRAETRLSSGARRGRYVQPGISFHPCC